MVEIETLVAFEQHLAGGKSLANVILQGLDLTGQTRVLLSADLSGTVFLGCQLETQALQTVVAHGAMVFPPFSGLPYSPYRGGLYSPEELYAGFDPTRPESYADTPDARIYAHWNSRGAANSPSLLETLAQRLHDHAVTDAMEEVLAQHSQGRPRRVVAIMGGHSMLRGQPDYRAVAELARELARLGFFLVSGGGPGAMEATHVGAWFAGRTEAELSAALEVLAKAPSYKDREWLSRAFEVRATWPLRDADRIIGESLGIPTWHYGHEPPNPFATHIAKYFANSVREDGLLTIARGGIIYSPGSAGTIQEVFQDACQNHYNTVGVVSPMIFLGQDFWTRTRPVYPLLEHLARGQDYARYLLLTDSRERILQALVDFDREQEARERAR
ncbi:LOG family protein [Archangium gephyra]|uniref:LOG family protein n=1 Tax=Archangium gephyra TaxID=48 RepID=UPI003B785111